MPARTALPFAAVAAHAGAGARPATAAAIAAVPIARAVVDDDDFLVDAERLEIDTPAICSSSVPMNALFVVGGDDDRERRARRQRLLVAAQRRSTARVRPAC